MNITRENIVERKNVLTNDLNAAKERIAEYDKKRQEDVALLNALTGALQQCDYFLNKIHDDNSDDGNDT